MKQFEKEIETFYAKREVFLEYYFQYRQEVYTLAERAAAKACRWEYGKGGLTIHR